MKRFVRETNLPTKRDKKGLTWNSQRNKKRQGFPGVQGEALAGSRGGQVLQVLHT